MTPVSVARQSLSDGRKPSMTRERDERMWNLAYRLAQSGKHRNYRMGVAGVWVSPSATIFIRRASPRKAGRHLSGSTKWFRKCLQRVHRRALILVTSIGGSLFWTNGWITAGTAGRWNNGRLAPIGWRHRDLRINAERRTDNALAAVELLA
jgi:hypothetical protein